jgi:hypothetical protein
MSRHSLHDRKAARENTLWTGVLEKRDDLGVVILQHFSFAVKG